MRDRKKEYAVLKALGRCVQCCSAKAMAGYSRCSSCVDARKQWIALRKKRNICKNCGRTNKNQKTLCNTCIILERINSKHLSVLSRDEAFKAIVFSDGKCQACKKNPGRKGLHLDHKNDSFRGLLCHGCNTALGLVQDNPNTLLKLVEYLKNRCDPPK